MLNAVMWVESAQNPTGQALNFDAESSNGRINGFEPLHLGSSPSSAVVMFIESWYRIK
jgi:hypothetical protein